MKRSSKLLTILTASLALAVSLALPVVAQNFSSIAVLNGTAEAPSMTFYNDTDTGYFRVGANSLGTSIGGTIRATFSTTDLTYALGGAGKFIIDNETDPVTLKLPGAAGGANVIVTDVNDNELLTFWGVASAVNELQVRNAAASGDPSIRATGGDTNISMDLVPKGTGGVKVNSGAAIAKYLSATATLDFASAAATVCSTDLTVTVTGATASNAALAVVTAPSGAVNAGSVFTAWVSSADTVTVRHCNVSAGANDPASGSYRVSVIQH